MSISTNDSIGISGDHVSNIGRPILPVFDSIGYCGQTNIGNAYTTGISAQTSDVRNTIAVDNSFFISHNYGKDANGITRDYSVIMQYNPCPEEVMRNRLTSLEEKFIKVLDKLENIEKRLIERLDINEDKLEILVHRLDNPD